ncbi:MAG: undecaprenyl-phosphate glucose phosphotransferase [Dysgonamonadaceae bacterium]|jgi:putative colanic acid biosynthesis UDP-glucose lipid carrier transferase|nr:undecaprenyl-phosphate glucose phosphotransferase [Dysgonamonadaceae bacterium]
MSKDKRGYGFLIKWLVILGDLIVLNVIFFAVYKWTGMDNADDFNAKLRFIILLLNFSYLFSVYFIPVNIYKPVLFTDKVAQRALSLITMHLIIFIVSLFFLKMETDALPRLIIYYYLLLFLVFTVWRVIAREALKLYRKTGRNYKRVIIVGAEKNGMNLYTELKKEVTYGYHIHGFFDDNLLLKNTLPNYIGTTAEVVDYALQNNIDEIYCTLPASEDEKIIRIFNCAEKNMIRLYIIPEFSRYLKKRLYLENIASMPVLAVRPEPLQFLLNQIVKRAFDIVFSLFFLIVFFPFLYLILGLFIKLSSPGPVIFKQVRTGIYGKDFNCYKFRSMKINADADEKQAERDDPRITKFGLFLRRFNLDELPQFFNVLRGDMSIIGPRPHMLKHTEQYSKLIDKYMVRHLVKPGISGWAQVNGYRGETRTTKQMDDRVKYDVWYLENWTFLLDLKILFVTIFNMFKGEKNAY